MRLIQQVSTVTLLLGSVAGVVACGDSTGPGTDAERVAFAARDGTRPALFVQNADGSNRSRIHFTSVSDEVPGNLPPFLLPVRDSTIRALGAVRWSPDGSRLAIIATVAFDQSEVVVMDADGSAMRTSSPNTQIITSDVAWSPDGSLIAYTMSTGPSISGVELFTTELASSRVTQVTSGKNFSPPGMSLAFSPDGRAVIWSEITATGEAPLFQRLSRVNRTDLTTGKEATLATDVAGHVFGISTDGERVLLVRRVATAGPDFLEDVVIRRLADGQETVLTAAPEIVARAGLTAGDTQVVIATPTGDGGLAWRVVPIEGGSGRALDSIETAASSLDIAPRR